MPLRLVEDVMLTRPKTVGSTTTVGALRALFADDHLQAVLVVDGARLVVVVERADLDDRFDTDAPAASVGRLDGRCVRPGADLDEVSEQMAAHGRTRLAVIDRGGELVGLLCRKRRGRGFCRD